MLGILLCRGPQAEGTSATMKVATFTDFVAQRMGSYGIGACAKLMQPDKFAPSCASALSALASVTSVLL